jgi:hypothetical protein
MSVGVFFEYFSKVFGSKGFVKQNALLTSRELPTVALYLIPSHIGCQIYVLSA